MIRFLQPQWFWLLACVPLVMIWRGRSGPVAAIEYSNVGLAQEVARVSRSRAGGWVWLLAIVAGILMIAGLARPQRLHSRTEVTLNGIDIVLGLDISGSMQALDFAIERQRINRIEVVKSVVSKFIEERPNDRIGLIAFAGVPFLISPLTLDHDWLQQNLGRLSVASVYAGRMDVIMADVDVDEKTLQAIADETGGKFYRATDTDSLQKIYEEINRFEKTAQTVQRFEHIEELYPWALIPALGILGLGSLLQHTRLRRLP